jgi:hypothetical protein
MTAPVSLIATYAGPQSSSVDDSYWLIIEQEKDNDLVTFNEIANLVDALYDRTPCIPPPEDALEKAAAADIPDRSKLYDSAKAVFGDKLQACKDSLAGNYSAVLRIYRSHKAETYKLVLSSGTHTAPAMVHEKTIITMDVKEQSSLTLKFPDRSDPKRNEFMQTRWIGPLLGKYGQIQSVGISVSPSGATVSFTEQVTGVLRLEYWTEYDIVNVDIPGTPTFEGSTVGDPLPAKLLAFYHYMVFEAEIEPPQEDETVSKGFLTQLCGDGSAWDAATPGRPHRPGDDDEDDDDDPGDGPGEPEKYGCQQHSPLYGKPEKYQELCCTYVQYPNDCLVYTERNKGGKDLSPEDKEKYKDAEIVMVSPKDPKGCGTTTWQLRVKALSCCGEVEALAFDMESTPDILPSGGSMTLYATGGMSPYAWKTSSKDTRFSNNKQKIETNDPYVSIFADADFCGGTEITITDGCTEANMTLRSDVGQWVEIVPAICAARGFHVPSPDYGQPGYAPTNYELITGMYKIVESISYVGFSSVGCIPWSTPAEVVAAHCGAKIPGTDINTCMSWTHYADVPSYPAGLRAGDCGSGYVVLIAASALCPYSDGGPTNWFLETGSSYTRQNGIQTWQWKCI